MPKAPAQPRTIFTADAAKKAKPGKMMAKGPKKPMPKPKGGKP